MKNHVTAEQNARDMLERMGVPDAQAYSAGDLVELANLIADADIPVALAKVYRCGKEAGDAEIAELRQQLAAAQAEVLGKGRVIGMAFKREVDLRQQVALLRDALDEAATSFETIQLRSYGDESYLNHMEQVRGYAASRAGVVRKALSSTEPKS